MKNEDLQDDTFLWTPQRLADYLGVSKSTLANWRMTAGRGPEFVKMGEGKSAAIRYRKSKIDEWVKSRMVETEG